jgi:hypothetical protein
MLPLVLEVALLALPAAAPVYPWLDDGGAAHERLEDRFAPPHGFTRVRAAPDSWAAWLRRLPLLPAGSPVLAYDGRTLAAPAAAVVALDVGERDLQQCADSIIRLRAEYLFSRGRTDDIAFHFTNGDLARFPRWAAGWRPRLVGKTKVVWERKGKRGRGHAALRAYLNTVYLWAGTASLAKQTPRAPFADAAAGDFVVLGGFPGHAVLILDVAVAPDGRKKALLGQGFMPAWFDLPRDGGLKTPSWPAPFPGESLRRF